MLSSNVEQITLIGLEKVFDDSADEFLKDLTSITDDKLNLFVNMFEHLSKNFYNEMSEHFYSGKMTKESKDKIKSSAVRIYWLIRKAIELASELNNIKNYTSSLTISKALRKSTKKLIKIVEESHADDDIKKHVIHMFNSQLGDSNLNLVEIYLKTFQTTSKDDKISLGAISNSILSYLNEALEAIYNAGFNSGKELSVYKSILYSRLAELFIRQGNFIDGKMYLAKTKSFLNQAQKSSFLYKDTCFLLAQLYVRNDDFFEAAFWYAEGISHGTPDSKDTRVKKLLEYVKQKYRLTILDKINEVYKTENVKLELKDDQLILRFDDNKYKCKPSFLKQIAFDYNHQGLLSINIFSHPLEEVVKQIKLVEYEFTLYNKQKELKKRLEDTEKNNISNKAAEQNTSKEKKQETTVTEEVKNKSQQKDEANLNNETNRKKQTESSKHKKSSKKEKNDISNVANDTYSNNNNNCNNNNNSNSSNNNNNNNNSNSSNNNNNNNNNNSNNNNNNKINLTPSITAYSIFGEQYRQFKISEMYNEHIPKGNYYCYYDREAVDQSAIKNNVHMTNEEHNVHISIVDAGIIKKGGIHFVIGHADTFKTAPRGHDPRVVSEVKEKIIVDKKTGKQKVLVAFNTALDHELMKKKVYNK